MNSYLPNRNQLIAVVWKSCCAALLLLAATPANAQFFTDECGILRVPSEYETIQAAINAASDGSIVLVSRGTYAENLQIANRKVALVSEGGPYGSIVSGGGSAPAIDVMGSDTVAVINGFKIEGGIPDEGGKIRVADADVWLINNVFSTETSAEPGAEVYLDRANAVIGYNLFSRGADLSLRSREGRLSLFHNRFEHRQAGMLIEQAELFECAEHYFFGVEEPVRIEDSQGVTMFDNRFASPGGPVIYCLDSHGAIKNSLFVGADGQGIVVEGQSNINMQNLTFFSNDGDAIDIRGGTASVFDSIFCTSSGFGVTKNPSATVNSDYNLFFENGGYGSGLEAGDHDLFEDPLLQSDYSLAHRDAGQSATSPAVDAGSQRADATLLPDDEALDWRMFMIDESGIFRAEKSMEFKTTRTDYVGDSGWLDMGYHSNIPDNDPPELPETITIRISMRDTVLSPGERFLLQIRTRSPRLLMADYYIILDVWGQYFFWPSWVPYPPDIDHQCAAVFPGETRVEILDFIWPSGAGSATDLGFWAALADPGTYEILAMHNIFWHYSE